MFSKKSYENLAFVGFQLTPCQTQTSYVLSASKRFTPEGFYKNGALEEEGDAALVVPLRGTGFFQRSPRVALANARCPWAVECDLRSLRQPLRGKPLSSLNPEEPVFKQSN